MRIQAIIFSILFSILPVAVWAGAGHDHGHSHHPVSQNKAEEIATKRMIQLVEKGKIDSSWKSVKVASSEKKKFGKKMEWVVTFNNKKISDASKQTLYIFLTLSGDYLAANFTGK